MVQQNYFQNCIQQNFGLSFFSCSVDLEHVHPVVVMRQILNRFI